jgi:hypothetical protein
MALLKVTAVMIIDSKKLGDIYDSLPDRGVTEFSVDKVKGPRGIPPKTNGIRASRGQSAEKLDALLRAKPKISRAELVTAITEAGYSAGSLNTVLTKLKTKKAIKKLGDGTFQIFKDKLQTGA